MLFRSVNGITNDGSCYARQTRAANYTLITTVGASNDVNGVLLGYMDGLQAYDRIEVKLYDYTNSIGEHLGFVRNIHSLGLNNSGLRNDDATLALHFLPAITNIEFQVQNSFWQTGTAFRVDVEMWP